MPVRRLAAATLAALALAAPAAALAQGAGDDQYQDPFGTEQGDTGGGSGGSAQDEETPAPAPAAAPQEEAPLGVSEPEIQSLPRTGADAGLAALAGVGLILTGVGLRLRVRVD